MRRERDMLRKTRKQGLSLAGFRDHNMRMNRRSSLMLPLLLAAAPLGAQTPPALSESDRAALGLSLIHI